MGYWSEVDIDMQEQAIAPLVLYVLPWWLTMNETV